MTVPTYKLCTDNKLLKAIVKKLVSYIATGGDNEKTNTELIGCLECCKLEFYRRLAASYEDKKICENGDRSIKI